MKVRMTIERETKNTIRYEEQPEPGKPPIFKNLYIAKWALPSPAPMTITLEVTHEQEETTA